MHIHLHIHDDRETVQKLDLIIKTLHKMGKEVEDLKVSLQTANDKLDVVGTNVTGIAQDVTFLKEKIAALENGATPAEVAELKALADGLGTKVDNISTATKDLDDSTDSTGG